MSENPICKFAKGKPMSMADDARYWAKEMVHRESRGNGDTENAMHRLERKYGISWRTFWSLKYRPPADVLCGVYVQLKNAYEAHCEQQERHYRSERAAAQAKAKAFAPLVRAADFVVGDISETGKGD